MPRVVDPHPHLQLRREIAFDRAGVGILGAFAGGQPLGPGVRLIADELLGLAHRQAAFNHLAGEADRIVGGNQRAGVAGAQRVVAQHRLHRLGQVQKAQDVRDVAAALVQRLGQLFLRVTETVHQLAVRGGLLDGVQVGALDVLDDRDLEHLGVGKVADDHRKVVQLGDLGRAPAAFAGDDLEKPAAIRVRADDERLQDAARADGVRELLQKLGLEVAARLVGVGDQLLDGDALGLRRGAVGRQRDIGHQGG